MWALLIPLLTQIFGADGIITQYAKTKADIRQKEQDYKLAVLQANTNQVITQIQSDSADVKNRLEATTQNFKQSTWYFFAGMIVFSIMFPSKAKEMWANLDIVPDWVQNTFVAMTLVSWGINPVVNGITWFKETAGNALESRRQYKLNKAAIFKGLQPLFTNGMVQSQVDIIDKAINAGEQQQ